MFRQSFFRIKKWIHVFFALVYILRPSIAAAEEADKPVMVPFGEYAAALAASRPDGEQWMGGVTNDASIQCDSFTHLFILLPELIWILTRQELSMILIL